MSQILNNMSVFLKSTLISYTFIKTEPYNCKVCTVLQTWFHFTVPLTNFLLENTSFTYMCKKMHFSNRFTQNISIFSFFRFYNFFNCKSSSFFLIYYSFQRIKNLNNFFRYTKQLITTIAFLLSLFLVAK